MSNNEQTVKAALSRVLTNIGNYPFESQGQLWGRDLSKVLGEAVEAVMHCGVVEVDDTLHFRPLVDRVEVIDPSGRAYVSMDAVGVSTSLQDGGRTLKVFIGHDQ